MWECQTDHVVVLEVVPVPKLAELVGLEQVRRAERRRRRLAPLDDRLVPAQHHHGDDVVELKVEPWRVGVEAVEDGRPPRVEPLLRLGLAGLFREGVADLVRRERVRPVRVLHER